MFGVILSALTLMTLFAVTIYMVQQNQEQNAAYDKQLGNVIATINTTNSATETVVKQQNASLGGLVNNVTTIQSAATETNKSLDNLRQSAVSKDALAKEAKSEQGTFNKVIVNGVALSAGGEDKLLNIGGNGLKFAGTTLNGTDNTIAGATTFQGDRLRLQGFLGTAQMRMTPFGGVDLMMSDRTYATLHQDGRTHINGSIVLDNPSIDVHSENEPVGTKGAGNGAQATTTAKTGNGPVEAQARPQPIGIYNRSSSDKFGIYQGEASHPYAEFGPGGATFPSRVKANEFVFTLPEGGDTYSMMKSFQNNALRMNLTSKDAGFEIAEDLYKPPTHTFSASGNAFHAGALGINTPTPMQSLHITGKDAAAIRLQSGNTSADLSTKANATTLNTNSGSIMFAPNNTPAVAFEPDGTTRLQGSFCLKDVCVKKEDMSTLLGTTKQVASMTQNFSTDPEVTRITSKNMCLNQTCMNDTQLQTMLQMDQKLTPYFKSIQTPTSQDAPLRFTTKTTFQQPICLDDNLCLDKNNLTQLFSAAQKNAELEATLKTQNDNFVRQMQQQKAYFDQQLSQLATTQQLQEQKAYIDQKLAAPAPAPAAQAAAARA